MVPLFSVRTGQNFGIGEILDLIPLIDWLTENHLHVLQILPIYETAPNETCPYLALSGFALDPIYLSLNAWDDFKKSDAVQKVFISEAANLEKWRESGSVCYESIRSFKYRLLKLAFSHFKREEWAKESPRAKSFQRFMTEKKEWLDDYALFRLLKEKNSWRHWIDWTEPFCRRDPSAMKQLIQENTEPLLFIKYLQWALWEQWKIVRKHMEKRNVLIMGDLPFLVSRDSADVWSQCALFSDRDTFGAPPDAFSEKGQDWGLPLFHWDAMEKNEFLWWRRRIREFRQYYDLIRLDHLVGFFRVWVMPKDRDPYFEPQGQVQQAKRGKQILRVIIEEAAKCVPIAEDLGVIPRFVSLSLQKFNIAGYKIMRWQKSDDHYVDPKGYPFVSLATTGTHDTDTLSHWWQTLPMDERTAFLSLLAHPFSSDEPFSDRLHHAILECLLESGSGLVILPIQDVFGFDEQINMPGTIGHHNWRYRLPVGLSDLERTSPYREKIKALKKLINQTGRYAAFAPLTESRPPMTPDIKKRRRKTTDKPP